MKVAILGPLDLEYMGGGETNSMMVGNLLSDAATSVTYFGAGCPLENVPMEKIYPHIKFDYQPSAFPRDPMSNPTVLKTSSLLSLGLIGMIGVKKILKRLEDYDTVYFSYPSLLSKRMIPKIIKQGKRVILANHGTFFEFFDHSSNPLLKALKIIGQEVLIRPLSKFNGKLLIHTQTSFQSSVYTSLGMDESNIIEIPQNNVNFREYKVGKPHKGFNVVFLGRLAKSKGVQLLMEIIKSNPDVSFKVIGNGPMLKKLMKVTDGTSAEIYGYISDKDKKAILESSDLMVVPSVFDSLSIASIEGLASGLPLLASNTAEGPKYILSKDGIFGKLIGRSVEEFTSQIKVYSSYKHNDPIAYYRDKIERRKRAMSIFNKEKVEDQLMKGFSTVIGINSSQAKAEMTVSYSVIKN